jgi:hypothetical protein
MKVRGVTFQEFLIPALDWNEEPLEPVELQVEWSQGAVWTRQEREKFLPKAIKSTTVEHENKPWSGETKKLTNFVLNHRGIHDDAVEVNWAQVTQDRNNVRSRLVHH